MFYLLIEINKIEAFHLVRQRELVIGEKMIKTNVLVLPADSEI